VSASASDERHKPAPESLETTRWTTLKRRLAPYGALARVEKPAGTWLLLWPGWWAIGICT
jgi:hypothetical protein